MAGKDPKDELLLLQSGSKQEIRERILRQVLKVNPSLGQGKSVEEFSELLMAEAKAARQVATTQGADEAKFHAVFRQMLASFETELKERQQALMLERQKINDDFRSLNERYVKDLVAFFLAAGTADFKDDVKEVMRKHKAFLVTLGVNITGLSQRIRAADQGGPTPPDKTPTGAK